MRAIGRDGHYNYCTFPLRYMEYACSIDRLGNRNKEANLWL